MEDDELEPSEPLSDELDLSAAALYADVWKDEDGQDHPSRTES